VEELVGAESQFASAIPSYQALTNIATENKQTTG
jgi:hypothetical protein